MSAPARREDGTVDATAPPVSSPISRTAFSGLVARLAAEAPNVDVPSLMALAERSRPIGNADLYAFGAITLIKDRRGSAATAWDAAEDPVTGRAVTTIWLRRNALFDEMKRRAAAHGYERGFAWVAACVERGADEGLAVGAADETLRVATGDRDGSEPAATVLRLSRETGLRPETVDVALWLAASFGLLGA